MLDYLKGRLKSREDEKALAQFFESFEAILIPQGQGAETLEAEAEKWADEFFDNPSAEAEIPISLKEETSPEDIKETERMSAQLTGLLKSPPHCLSEWKDQHSAPVGRYRQPLSYIAFFLVHHACWSRELRMKSERVLRERETEYHSSPAEGSDCLTVTRGMAELSYLRVFAVYHAVAMSLQGSPHREAVTEAYLSCVTTMESLAVNPGKVHSERRDRFILYGEAIDKERTVEEGWKVAWDIGSIFCRLSGADKDLELAGQAQAHFLATTTAAALMMGGVFGAANHT